MNLSFNEQSSEGNIVFPCSRVIIPTKIEKPQNRYQFCSHDVSLLLLHGREKRSLTRSQMPRNCIIPIHGHSKTGISISLRGFKQNT
jgi:hypothetical protein